ncbi:MAG TPA: NADH-quinone oxidoreductase subunit C [Jiangellaceae bacterium]|nr:NADH-quinone oxidoreductase subunit C [Jiangellaceae bacterium]
MTEPAEPAGASQETDWAVRLAEAAGEGAQVSDAFGVPVFDVPADRWTATLQAARDAGLSYFDWLSAVDELDEGFSLVVHVADVDQRPVLHLLVRTRVPRDDPRIASVTGVYRGAAWHERETHEMFGIEFDGHPNLAPLLLPDGFEGNPLRKEFVLAARAAKPWPGAKEPGEGGEGRAAPSRRRMLPPGVPDPSWGPRHPAPPNPPDEEPFDQPGGEADPGASESGSDRS